MFFCTFKTDVILLPDRCVAVVTQTETHLRCYEYSSAVVYLSLTTNHIS